MVKGLARAQTRREDSDWTITNKLVQIVHYLAIGSSTLIIHRDCMVPVNSASVSELSGRWFLLWTNVDTSRIFENNELDASSGQIDYQI